MTQNRWTDVTISNATPTLRLRGDWTLEHLSSISEELDSLQLAGDAARVLVDGEALGRFDTAGAMQLVKFLQRLEIQDSAEIQNFHSSQHSIYMLAQECVEPAVPISKKSDLGFLAEVGKGTVDVYRAGESILSFIGLSFAELLRAVCRPASIRVKELVVQIQECGLNAVPIVVLVNFLIGIVIAYLSGVQLEYYGANVFVVDGVALAVVRELSPILVAIIAAGRSGSAFTAQIGAMKLNEEVDAIATLGLSPVRVLVVPRLLALIFVLPILVFVGDIAGILGGLVIADFRLGVTGATFIDRLQVALTMTHVLAGLFKAPFFAFFIATIGCRMGLAVENNARSVGDNTTSTVVRSIVVVILLNAAFAVIYSELGI